MRVRTKDPGVSPPHRCESAASTVEGPEFSGAMRSDYRQRQPVHMAGKEKRVG